MRSMSKILALVVLTTVAVTVAPAQAAGGPTVVLALIDTGINPYNPAFRDDSATAQLSPSAYLPDYPADCPPGMELPSLDCAMRLELTLDADSYAAAVAADAAVWETVWDRQLYYIPGTKIVGITSFGSGGTRCKRRVQGQELPVFIPPPGGNLNAGGGCPERLLLDDHGHGTMTASRAIGIGTSLAPTARVVIIEGLGSGSSLWASQQPWIDVQSNSWGSLIPAPADTADMEAFTEAAKRHLVIVASGNGIAFSGLAPTPTQFDGLGAQDVVLVGGHDNGRLTAWSGTPAHVVGDAFGGLTAIHNSFATAADPMSCCTSAAAPYAAGGAAAVALKARQILGDSRTGVHAGVVARGPAGIVSTGPLADGIFTLAEWRQVVLATADARPREGQHDGLLNFTGRPGAPSHPEHGVGENPFCQLCFTSPVQWSDVPPGDDVPAYTQIGYGAVNEFSSSLAAAVLSGTAPMPERPVVDEWFTRVDESRDLLWELP